MNADYKKLRPSFYGSARSRLPVCLRTLISQFLFLARGQPRHRVFTQDRIPSCLEIGTLVISIDLELAWAWRFARTAKAGELSTIERRNVPMILDKLELLRMPATWAVVGHLFLDRCRKSNNGMVHEDMPRPSHFQNEHWNFMTGDWYDTDPGTSYEKAPDWYAPDLINRIIRADIKHEIACHSFSHIGFNKIYCTHELAAAELNQCARLMARFNIKPLTMVFPGNEAGYFDLLFDSGYRYIRYNPHAGAEISLPVKLPSGLWAIPESANIVPDDEWDSGYILWRLKKYVDKAIEKRSLCHLWLHPSMSPQRMTDVLFPLLEYCARSRDAGKLTVMTMAGIGALMERKCAG